jgi:hypothetical protein
MATNPLRPDLNRARQIKSAADDVKQSISLFDIDYAMMTHLEDTILPNLDDNGKLMKIPVIYGNSERWNGARAQGVYRDMHGKIQLPLMMIRRTSVAKNEAMSMLNRHVSYSTIRKYSKDNRYDRFTLLGTSTKPKYELFNITMPDYVEVNYECMVWTNFTEQLNAVIEQLQFAGSYWGDKEKFKFNTSVGEFNIINEVGDGTERINRVEFSLNVKAYLLPEKFDGENTTKKSFSTKKFAITTETDMTGNGRLEGFLTTPSPYYDNKDLVDFLSINGSKTRVPITNNTITFTGIKLIKAPSALQSVIAGSLTIGSDIYDVKLYINGVRYYDVTHFTAVYSNNQLIITFNTVGLGFTVDTNDIINIAGKFIEV